MSLQLLHVEPEEQESKCKGLLYRCRIRSYAHHTKQDDVVVTEIRLRKAKKDSCSCPLCQETEDIVKEFVEMDSNEEFLKDMVHGAMYSPVIETSKDWETGMEDVDNVYFQRVEEEE